ncbi:MAG: choice-of-anchor J domain-containing protein [Bacteroidales bacterium]|jgi:hypothetical protein
MKRFLFSLIAIIFAIQGWTQTPAALPYSCNFEDPNEITQWTLSNSSCVNRWCFGQAVNAAGFSGTSMYISNDSLSNNYTVSSVYTVTATRSIVSDGSAFYQLAFDFNCQGESSYDYVKVYLVPNDTNYVGSTTTPFYAAAAFTSPQLITNNGVNNYLNFLSGRQYYDIPASLMGSAGNTVKLIFVWRNDGSGGTQPPAAIDNITLISTNCPSPSNLSAMNITSTSADITWISDAQNINTTLEYKLKSETWGDAIQIQNATSPYLLQGLYQDSAYEVRINSDCSSGESIYRLVTFVTAIADLPFEESFDSYGTGTSVFPSPYWKKITSNAYPYIATTNYSAPGSMYLYAASGAYNYLASPPIDPSISISSLSAYFKLYKSNAAYNITVGVMSGPTDTTTFDSITNLSPSSASSWEGFNVNFSNYQGTGQYIAFKVQGYGATNAMYIDNLTIYYTPSCSIPTGLTDIEANATPNSIELDWDATDDANVVSWIVEYKPLDVSTWQSTDAYSHPFTLNGLQSSIVYQVRLAAICTSGDTTLSTETINVGMQCESISDFPWNEGFESAWYVAWGLNTGTHPWCWTNIDGGSQSNGVWRRTTSSSYIHTGSGALQMYSGSTSAGLSGDWFITPTISLTGNQRLRFWAKGYSTSYTEILTLKILDVTTNGMVDAEADTSLFVELMPNTEIPTSDWTEYEINLSSYNSDYQIAFVRNTTGGYYLNIDDISISDIPACARPTNISVNYITDTEAELTWTPANQGDAPWYFYYKTATATDYDSVLVNANTHLLQNLISNTTYNIYLRTDCVSELSEATNPISITTAPCAAITTLPYTDSFDTYGTGSGTFPTCWINKSTTSYPYISTTNNSAPGSMYFYAASGYNLAVTPCFDATLPLNTLRANFKLRKTSSAYNISVGVMANPNDISTFYEIENLSPSVTSVWEDFEVSFAPYQGQGRFIAFKVTYSGSSNYMYLDDLVISEIPACAKPTQLTASNITTTEAEMSWTPGNTTDNAWWLYWKEAGATNYDSVYVTTNPYLLQNLNPSIGYNIYMSTDCGAEFSEPSSVYTFHTLCDIISTFPYSENFDSYGISSGTFPSCWFRPILNTTTPYPSIVTANAYSAPANLRFQSASASAPTYAITPQLNADINTLKVKFMLKAESTTSSGNILVGVMSNPADTSTFELVQTIQPTSTAYTQYEIPFNNTTLTGIGNYIAFKHVTVAYNYYYWLDDVIIDYIPACAKPTQLVASNSTTIGVDLSWTEGNFGDANWWLYYKPINSTDWDSIPVNSNPYNLTGLNHSSTYNWYLRTDCGMTLSEASDISVFNTLCDGTITQFPWNEGFELDWVPAINPGNKPAPNCWTVIDKGTTTFSSTGSGERIWSFVSSSSTAHSGNGSARCYTDYGTTDHNDWLISPQITLQGNERLRFWAMRSSSSTLEPDEISIFISDEDIVLDTTGMGQYGNMPEFTQVFNQMLPVGSWQEYEVNLSQYVGNRYIAFVRQGSPDGFNLRLDDVSVEELPNCMRPSDITFSNITPTQVDINFVEGHIGDATWWVYYKESDSTSYDSIQIFNNPYTLDNLTSNTAYDIYMKTDCSSELSESTSVLSFRTTCDAISSFPWTEGFENTWVTTANAISPSNYSHPYCWINFNGGNSSSYWTRSTTSSYIHSGSATAYMYGGSGSTYINSDWLISPKMELTGNERIKFWTKKSSSSYTDEISLYIYDITTNGDIASANDTVNFIKIMNSTPQTTSWVENEVSLGSFVGNYRIAFVRNANAGGGYLSLDDIQIDDTLSSCAIPTALQASNITTTDAEFSWVNGRQSDNAWWLYYKSTTSTDWDSIHITSNPYTLTGLNHSSSYNAYIKTDCGIQLSEASAISAFNTSCEGISTFPYTENFDTYGTGESVMPTCWSRINTYTSGIRPYVNTGGHTSNCLYFYAGTSGTYNIAVMPPIDININPINTLMMRFYYKNNNSADKLVIGIMSDPTDVSTFDSVTTIIAPTTGTWAEYEVNFNAYNGIGSYIVLKNAYATTGAYAYMDDLVIDIISTPCTSPTNVTVPTATITNTTATVNWTAGGSETAWQVRLDTTTPIDVNTPTYQLPGLTQGTSYIVYVRANCGGNYSSWASQTFSTIGYLAPTVTTVQQTGTTQTSTTLNGSYVQATNPILVKGFQWKLASATTWTTQPVATGTTPFTYILNGLTANTQYEFRAYVETSVDTTYGATLQFTTLAIVAPTVVTNPATTITQVAATLNGTITAGSETITAQGFEWKLASATTWTTQAATGTTITYPLTGLTANTAYEFRAFATTASGTIYGTTQNFTTSAIVAPTVVTNPATTITQVAATLNGTITAGSETITAQGFEWKLATATTWTTQAATGTTITYPLTGLTANTAYEFRAFVTTASGTIYGTTQNFSTPAIVAPNVLTNPATSIGTTTATLNGTITTGSETITAQGFEYKLTSTSTWTGAIDVTVTGTTTITANVTGLTANTQYDVRAYAQTDDKTYGNIITFKTDSVSGLNDIDANKFFVTMYPNPATSTTKLVVSGVEGETDIAINDVQGKLIYKTTAKAVNGKVEQTIDVNNFAKGVYYVRIQNKTTSRTQKLIVLY